MVNSTASIRSEYLDVIRRAFDSDKDRLDQEIERWRSQFDPHNALFGYVATSWPLALASVAAFLAEQDRNPALARFAGDILLRYRDWPSIMPADVVAARPEYEEGVPPLDPMFQPIVFIPACERIRDHVTEAEWNALAEIVAASLRPLLRFPEWGAHNRAMLRAANLALAAHAFPQHADAGWWAEMADELAEASWGRWSIEDAMLYQPIWLRALIVYAEARGRTGLSEHVPVRAHLRAMTQMITPLGTLPDFGDSHWMSNQLEWLACFEWGAAAYCDPSLRWAADRLWQAVAEQPASLGAAAPLMLAWQWCDETVPSCQPAATPDALDDLVAKKVVFRTGWGERDTYACLNYRDEGDYGRIDRDYLRATLAVSAEKMHHGHSDENSFVLLVSDGTVLLHDGGYRESPPDGIYRADLFHNRLVEVETQDLASLPTQHLASLPTQHLASLPTQDIASLPTQQTQYLASLRYHPIRTERLYWTRLGDAQVSRTRAHDAPRGLLWDRTVFFLAALDCFVVIDSACALRPGKRTLSALWWTTDVLDQGAAWRDTWISAIQGWRNRDSRALLVAFPQPELEVSVSPLRRSFQQEQVVAGTWSGDMQAGDWASLVTVLWAHPRGALETRPAAAQVIQAEPAGRGVAVRLDWQGEVRTLATLTDLAAGLVEEDIRPRYDPARGLVRYGDIESDAHLVYTRRKAGAQWAGFVNGTLLRVKGVDVYRGKPHAMFQEDRSARPGAPARFRWQSGAAW